MVKIQIDSDKDYKKDYKLFKESITFYRRKELDLMAFIKERGTYECQPEWKKIRKLMIQISGGKCEICGSSPDVLDVHHLTYDRYCNENLDDLQVLCKPCHRTVTAANRRLTRHNIKREESTGEIFDSFSF